MVYCKDSTFPITDNIIILIVLLSWYNYINTVLIDGYYWKVTFTTKLTIGFQLHSTCDKQEWVIRHVNVSSKVHFKMTTRFHFNLFTRLHGSILSNLLFMIMYEIKWWWLTKNKYLLVMGIFSTYLNPLSEHDLPIALVSCRCYWTAKHIYFQTNLNKAWIFILKKCVNSSYRTRFKDFHS